MSRSSSPKRRRQTKEAIANASPAQVGHCEATGKHQYPSKSQAKAALKRINRERRASQTKTRPETRVYVCPHCGGWHTTSQPIRPDPSTPRTAVAPHVPQLKERGGR
jgi:hypothetical protein